MQHNLTTGYVYSLLIITGRFRRNNQYNVAYFVWKYCFRYSFKKMARNTVLIGLHPLIFLQWWWDVDRRQLNSSQALPFLSATVVPLVIFHPFLPRINAAPGPNKKYGKCNCVSEKKPMHTLLVWVTVLTRDNICSKLSPLWYEKHAFLHVTIWVVLLCYILM